VRGAAAAPAAPYRCSPARNASGTAIAGSYIVAVREGADPHSVAAVAQVEPALVYTAAFNGFAAELNQGQLNALLHNPSVEYVEEDQVFTTAVDQLNAWWGLDRINQRYLPLDGKYSYGYTGSTVYSYIIATGIRTAHEEFEGRASNATTPSSATDRTATGTVRTSRARSTGASTASPRRPGCAGSACWTATARARPQASSPPWTGCGTTV
jgi:subtilisin family serine protease